jgi:large conductance mechanosensitive channel
MGKAVKIAGRIERWKKDIALFRRKIMLAEFRKFALKGSMLDMAVGIVIGAAFGAIVTSLVNDIIMPPIGLLLGGIDFSNFFWTIKAGDPSGPYITITDAQAAGAVTINYGLFINTLISFLIIALVLFIIIRSVNNFRKAEEAAVTTKKCPFCISEIQIDAIRCAYCNKDLE